MPTLQDWGFTMKEVLEHATNRIAALGRKPTERLIVVSLARQLLALYQGSALVRSYAASTSRRPPSNVRDSLGTPRGLHEIAERVGAGAPPGMVFVGRRPTGRHFSELPEMEQARSLVTTRILWLRGLEPGFNAGDDAEGRCVDTHRRYVYIHGTNREDLLGSPASSGCVQLGNLDVIDLHDRVRAGDLVWMGD
jgi:hypothetical protein